MFAVTVTVTVTITIIVSAVLTAAEPAPEAWAVPEPLCCSQGYERRVLVGTGELAAAGVTVRVLPATMLAATSRALDAHRLEIRLRAVAPGQGTFELVDAGQIVRLRRQVQVMTLTTDSEKHIATEERRPDGSVVFTGQLILRPYLPGLDVCFACLNPRVKVPDGLGSSWIASETFTPNAAGDSAQTTFRMIREPGGRYVPFTYILYQAGEQISAP